MILPPDINQADDEKTRWVYERWDEMRRIQPGTTRGVLLVIFEPQGGLSHNTHQSFMCRRCRRFLVDVTFDMYDETTRHKFPYDERDTVKTISSIHVGIAAMD